MDRHGVRPGRADRRLRPARADLQAAHADAARPRAAARAAAAPGAAGAAGRRRQVAPGRRRRQGADPADRAVRRRARRAAPDRVPARLRHVDGPVPVLGLRRVAEQPDPAAGGVRHVRHEVGAERRAQPVHPGRLVGRVLRRQQRLGDPDRGRRARPAAPRRPRGRGALRAAGRPGRAAVLRPRRGRRAGAVARDGPAHAGLARAEGAGVADGPRVRRVAVHARRDRGGAGPGGRLPRVARRSPSTATGSPARGRACG